MNQMKAIAIIGIVEANPLAELVDCFPPVHYLVIGTYFSAIDRQRKLGILAYK